MYSALNEYPQVFQKWTLSNLDRFRNHEPNKLSTMDVPGLVFVLWPKIALPVVLFGRVQSVMQNPLVRCEVLMVLIVNSTVF